MKRALLSILLLAGTAFAASPKTPFADPAPEPMAAMYMAATHNVGLTWVASVDDSPTTPATYFIYKGTTATDCTAPTIVYNKITPTAITGLTFTDNSVSVGQVLCYKASTLIAGLEGNQSAPAIARILPAAPVLAATSN